MLDPWIIEEIRRREESERESERSYCEIPLVPNDEERDRKVQKEDVERGVAIIDYRL